MSEPRAISQPSPVYDDLELIKLGLYLQRKGAHERFTADMVPALLAAAQRWGIDPFGLIAQSGKETAFGHFGGKVEPYFRNTCGMKNRYPQGNDLPHDHAQFQSWTAGATVQCLHLGAYMGRVPVGDITMLDPRFYLVNNDPPAKFWRDLGGKWAPSDDYGLAIEDMVEDMLDGTT